MKWGFFTVTHIVSLILAAGMLVGLYFALRKRSRKTQTAVLGVLSFLGIAAIIYNLLRWDEPLAYLPLHLCSINAMILPVVVFTRNKTMGNLLLVWCLGALAALVLNFEMVDVEIFGEVFFFYYFPHVMEFGIPILLVKLGHVQKDPKCIGSTMGITMLIYTFVHFMNLLVNHICAVQGMDLRVNYMFSLEATNPLTALFYKLVPYPYWHMYMVLPIVFVYLLAVYSPQILGKIKQRHAATAK